MLKRIRPLNVAKNIVKRLEKIGGKKEEKNMPLADGKTPVNVDLEPLTSWKQIKYIPKFLSKKERIIIKSSVLLIVICLLLMGYLFLNSVLVEKPKAGGTYTEIIVGAAQYLNPLYSSISEADRDLTKLAFAGLVRYNDKQEIAPDLARDWFVDDKGTTYTFQLRNDVYWPDGKQFSAEDVVFTIEAIQNKEYESPIRENWLGIEVKAIDELTVQFTLPKPFTPFIDNATVGILPAHLWQEILPGNAKLAELNIKPVGLGPYRVDSFTKDKQGIIKSYSFKRNENYHLGAPYIEKIIFKFQPTFKTGVESLKNRNADGLNFLPLNLKKFLEPRKDLNYYSLSLPQYTAIFFNIDNNDILKPKKMRQALEAAIDKKKIVEETLGGEAQAIEGPILPGFPGYSENMPITSADADGAKKLLTELGWEKKKIEATEITGPAKATGAPQKAGTGEATSTKEVGPEVDAEGFSRFLFKGDKELLINLTVPNQPQSVAVGKLIAKMWQAVGVKTNLIVIEPEKIQKDVIRPRGFEALLFGEILGADPDPYPFWHSSQAGDGGLNLSNFKNSEADKLLETMRKEKEYKERDEAYIKFAAILKREIPAIFLYNPNYTYVVSTKIKGINLGRIVSPSDRLNEVHKWYIKTRKGFK